MSKSCFLLLFSPIYFQTGAATTRPDRGHSAGRSQTAEGEECKDATGLLLPADRVGAGAPWGPQGPPAYARAWHTVRPRVGSIGVQC